MVWPPETEACFLYTKVLSGPQLQIQNSWDSPKLLQHEFLAGIYSIFYLSAMQIHSISYPQNSLDLLEPFCANSACPANMHTRLPLVPSP